MIPLKLEIKQTGATTISEYDVINKLLPEAPRNIVREARRARFLDGHMMRQLQLLSNTITSHCRLFTTTGTLVPDICFHSGLW
jgi:hypothetical protein